MAKIEDFVDVACDYVRKDFVRQHPYPVLLLELEGDAANAADWSFKTVTIASRQINVARILGEDGPLLSEEAGRYRLFPVIKSTGNPWQERISVGRARNNDIVLPHRSVSKLHAYLTMHGQSLLVTDAGSRNHTRIKGQKLPVGRATPVDPGDTIAFGGLTLKVVSPADLYDLVHRHLAPRETSRQ